jgi:transcription initiation factor TFIID subunit TAF12
MSSLLVNPNESPIQPAHDPYWDKPMTRREAFTLFKRLATNDNELMGMADTASILINFICERKLGIVDRKEVDEYVAAKTKELAARRAAMKDAAAKGEDPEVLNPAPATAPAEAAPEAGGNLTDAKPNS